MHRHSSDADCTQAKIFAFSTDMLASIILCMQPKGSEVISSEQMHETYSKRGVRSGQLLAQTLEVTCVPLSSDEARELIVTTNAFDILAHSK